MATTAEFRNGLCIEFNNELYKIVEFQHVKPGKGPAFVRTKLKNLKTGKVIPNTFTAGAPIDIARVERRPYQFLYKDDNGYNFMNNETFEQISIEEEMIDNYQFMKEGQGVEIMVHADTETPLTCELPAFVELEITYTEPGFRGDTASNTLKKQPLKPALLFRFPYLLMKAQRFVLIHVRELILRG